MSKGLLIVVSGYSGAGKGTLMKKLLQKYPGYELSISATTRKPRDGETDGVEYFFKTEEEFRHMIENGELIEYEGYVGHYYGTPKKYVEEMMAEGKDVILEIETQGAEKIRSVRECVSIFIVPPSLSELKRRLEERKTENSAQIEGRMAKCRQELPCAYDYDYVVLNDDLESCIRKVDAIIEAERQKVSRNIKNIDKIIFG